MRDQAALQARLHRLVEILAPSRKTRIADVGANPVHVPPYQMLLDHGYCEVWGFEPDERAFAELQKRKGDPNQTYLPFAIGDGKKKTLHICTESGFTSLYEPSVGLQDYLNHFRRAMTVTKKDKYSDPPAG
jgi:hypothetical protein